MDGQRWEKIRTVGGGNIWRCEGKYGPFLTFSKSQFQFLTCPRGLNQPCDGSESVFPLVLVIYLNFDPAVHRLEDLGVVDGMDLDQQGQTLGHYGREGARSETADAV